MLDWLGLLVAGVVGLLVGVTATFILRPNPMPIRGRVARPPIRYFFQSAPEGFVKVAKAVPIEMNGPSAIPRRFASGGDLSVELDSSSQNDFEIWGVWTEKDGSWRDVLGNLPDVTVDQLRRKYKQRSLAVTLETIGEADGHPEIQVAVWAAPAAAQAS